MVMETFIRQQPQVIAAAIRATAAHARLLPDAPMALAGSGSSLNALTVARAAAPASRRKDLAVVGPQPCLDGLRAGDEAPASLLVLSQSGASTTSVALAREAAAAGSKVTIVTCESASEIAQLGLPTLALSIDGEPIGPKTKGFTATLAACLVLFGGDRLPAFSPEDFAALVEASRERAADLAAMLGNLDYLMVSGNGRMAGIALEGSLKVSEIVGLPTAGFETEELLHGRLHGAGPHSLVVMLAADDRDRETAVVTARAMHERGVRVVLVNTTATATAHDWIHIPNIPAPWDALAAIVPLQWLAWHLARARGLEPEAMRYPGLSAALSIKLQAPAR